MRVKGDIILPPYVNKVSCAILLVKRIEIGKGANSLGTVIPMADSTVVLSAKVNCRPLVTV